MNLCFIYGSDRHTYIDQNINKYYFYVDQTYINYFYFTDDLNNLLLIWAYDFILSNDRPTETDKI